MNVFIRRFVIHRICVNECHHTGQEPQHFKTTLIIVYVNHAWVGSAIQSINLSKPKWPTDIMWYKIIVLAIHQHIHG